MSARDMNRPLHARPADISRLILRCRRSTDNNRRWVKGLILPENIKEMHMRYVCMLLGLLTGKTKVKCVECKNLDSENKCYGHKMPDDIINKPIMCGFYKSK